MENLVIILSSLLSGLIGVGISTYYYRRYEARKVKLEAFRRFVGNRYYLKGAEFTRSINEIYVVFNDSPKVMEALSHFHATVITPGRNNEDDLVRLFKAMSKELNMDSEKFNDSFFLTPFNTKHGE